MKKQTKNTLPMETELLKITANGNCIETKITTDKEGLKVLSIALEGAVDGLIRDNRTAVVDIFLHSIISALKRHLDKDDFSVLMSRIYDSVGDKKEDSGEALRFSFRMNNGIKS